MRIQLTLLALAPAVFADVYMHNPRGSNNRNCRNDNNENRRNGNRLFDSQNNNKGGYSCPRSYPFDCYKYANDNNARATCNDINEGANNGNGDNTLIYDDITDPANYGELRPRPGNNAEQPVRNERMSYYAGSVLPLEWTAQHGCGGNSKVHCDMIIQIACEESLCDKDTSNYPQPGQGRDRCVRDGTPITNNDGNNLNDEATNTIPDNENNGVQKDMRYGRHETLTYYKKCKNRERNKGLWTADQNVNNNQGATASRQNPNGNRNGLECPEESEYYPYWHDSPWKDLAILTSDTTKCAMYQAESQNVKARNECTCKDANNQRTGNSQLPNNADDCVAEGCEWITVPAHNVPAPACMAGAFSRDNHLGNAATPGSDPIMMNWTIPDWLAGQNFCVLRLRYNMSSADEDETPVIATSALNDNGQNENGTPNPQGQGTPIYDRDNNEIKSYKTMTDVPGVGQNAYSLMGFATNTNQYARTFQDRTYTFSVKPKTTAAANGESCESGTLYNLNVRGKRGNIVQAYPSVEYDFVPNKLEITEDDCLHLQWTGSDYNPNRNPNNGEGGPPNPNNLNEGKSDRTNMVQMESNTNNFPILTAKKFTMFSATDEQWRRMTYLDQPLSNTNINNNGQRTCNTAQQLDANGINNRQDRERDYRNCGKLSGQKIPHVDIGIVKAGKEGYYQYMSTRNNNFSNRGQKGYVNVGAGKTKLGGGAIFGIVAASIVGVAAVGIGGKKFMDSRSGGGSKSYLPTSSKGGSFVPSETKSIANAPGSTVTAKHPYDANEAGELSFKAGAKITVLRKDDSGWWKGRLANGTEGVFPSNYVK